ncbi:unnamed protein product [Sympodiomycopsis kandeliae]
MISRRLSSTLQSQASKCLRCYTRVARHTSEQNARLPTIRPVHTGSTRTHLSSKPDRLGPAYQRYHSTGTNDPLLKIQDAVIPGLKADTLSWTITDSGLKEAWAITGPAAEKGGAVKAEIVKALMGMTTLRKRTPGSDELTRHPKVHSTNFTTDSSGLPREATFQMVSFSSRLSSINGVGGGNGTAFVDFSTRYGAIREEDRITVYESIMQSMGTETGLIAQINLRHDPLADPEIESRKDYEQGITRLPWSSQEAETKARALAQRNHQRVMELAPLLKLDNPADESSSSAKPLLFQPVISLSNGQTRRARILTALCNSPDVLVLEEPFTGLDPPSRKFLSELLKDFHATKSPRIVCVLREQDDLPDFVTHLLSIGQDGEIVFQGALPTETNARGAIETAADLVHHRHKDHSSIGGYARVQAEASQQGVGLGDTSIAPIVSLNDINIAYKGTKVLDSISFDLPAGSRTILVGDNGSGKTTLLSLLTGSHPQSFSFDASQLSLFSNARSDPKNSTPLLLKRIGQLSPELINSFPRKSVERGGLTVKEAVQTGFAGIFSRRESTLEQDEIVTRLVERFQNVITSSHPHSSSKEQNTSPLDKLLSTPFINLTPGSQVLILFLRSIVHTPTLLILDEPFQGMSAEQVSTVRSFLDNDQNCPTRTHLSTQEKEIEAKWFKSMAWILVSHFENEWPISAARLIRLEKGRLVEHI